MVTRWILGLAVEPTLIGLDAALVEVQGQWPDLHVRVQHWLTEPYPRELRDLLVRSTTPEQGEVRILGRAHRLLGEAVGAGACRTADQASVSLQGILCAAVDGLTAWHENDGKIMSHLTLDVPAAVAERTGLTVVSNFRSRDLACGGQGTPLSALADWRLFSDDAETRVLLHLGGVAQLVYLPAHAEANDVLGWEIGPGTVLLEAMIHGVSGGKERLAAASRYAVQGRQVPELLERWLHHPHHLRRPPKSTHRSLFGEEFVRQTLVQAQQRGWGSHDLLCTAHHLIARSVADDVRRRLPRDIPIDRIILTGNGANNGLLWRLLEEQLPGIPLESSNEHGVPAEAREAVNAAVLAALLLDGVPANLPSATGAAGNRLLGSLTPGSLTNWSQCLRWMTGQMPLEED
jgi:anhydro-N-acetylmuramic acid kinase